MAKTSTANWQQIDTETLPQPIAALYHDYKASYAQMKVDRNEFEKAMQEAISVPAGQKAVFGYNFGKLSIAIVADDKPAAKPTSAVSLSSLIKRG